MEEEERQAFINMRKVSIKLARAIAANKSPETLGELNQEMLYARSCYEIVRDQHLDITPGVRKARHKVESKQKAFDEAFNKVDRRREELASALQYDTEKGGTAKTQKEIDKKLKKLTEQESKMHEAAEKVNNAKFRLAEKRTKAAQEKYGSALKIKEMEAKAA